MDTVIPVMNIFLAEALSLSWSTFILVRNKEIKFIIQSAPSIQYQICKSLKSDQMQQFMLIIALSHCDNIQC